MAQAIYCPSCEVWYTAELRGKSCPACGEELIHARYPAGGFPDRPAKKQKKMPTASRAHWDSILKKDPCSICGKSPVSVFPRERAKITIDHIVPKALGGSKGHWTNRTGMCFDCNQDKAHTPLLFFLLQRQGVDIDEHLDEDGNWLIPPELAESIEQTRIEREASEERARFVDPKNIIYKYTWPYPREKKKRYRNRDPDH